MANKKSIPVVFEGAPKPLFELGPDARMMWDHLTSSIPRKILVEADSATLTMLSEIWELFCRTRQNYVDALEAGGKSWNQYNAMSGCISKFIDISKRFGMTPLDRSKVVPKGTGKSKEENDSDPMADLSELHKMFESRN